MPSSTRTKNANDLVKTTTSPQGPTRLTRSVAKQAGPQRASLLGLPAELRNRIYEFALLSKNPSISHFANDLHNDPRARDSLMRAPTTQVSGREIVHISDLDKPGLLATNKQIRAETKAMFYYHLNVILVVPVHWG
ncbi:hypothetical protein MBLNU230_g0622t1 [Neophaeotheca triangularis]